MEKVPHQPGEGGQVNLSLLFAHTSFLPPARNAFSQTPHFSSPYLPDNGFHLNLKYSVILGEGCRSQVEHYIVLWKLAAPPPRPSPSPGSLPHCSLPSLLSSDCASCSPWFTRCAPAQGPLCRGRPPPRHSSSLPGSRPWGTSWKMQEQFGIQLRRPARSEGTDCGSTCDRNSRHRGGLTHWQSLC